MEDTYFSFIINEKQSIKENPKDYKMYKQILRIIWKK